jgi:integrase
VRNAYSVVQRALARAVIDEELTTSPCDVVAKAGALPRVRDKQPGARETWIYLRSEALALTTSEQIPFDRRVLYAVLLYTGVRVGEAHALTWADLDTTTQPLAKLVVSKSVHSHTRTVKGTKTGATRLIPVHPVLLAMLWRWRSLLGGNPAPSSPLIPNNKGRARTYPATRDLLQRDLARLRIPERGQLVHGMRRTFISLARSDGARGDIMRWITHTPPLGSLDGYTSPVWSSLCEAVRCLNLDNAPDNAPEGGKHDKRTDKEQV